MKGVQVFYTEEKDEFLRFGDVIKGYISTFPSIKQPFLSMEHAYKGYNINVALPGFSVVVTPCCSVEDHMVCLTPLIQLKSSYAKNPHFTEDFTIINREIEPQKCFAPDDWEKMDFDTKEEILARKQPYTLLNIFIYEGHELFSSYKLRDQYINYYMIDFRNVNTIRCEMIKRAEQMGKNEIPIIESKCLQLSDTTREELRNKMSYYYARRPEEERAIFEQ
jgi:hypothetical protein